MFRYIKYKFDQALEKSIFNLIIFLFILSLLGIIIFAIIFYLLYLLGIVSTEGILTKYIWQTFTYFIDVGTISGEEYSQNTAGDKIFKIIVTIFGVVIFSSFIGIISQALASRIEALRSGEGVVAEKNHIIIFNFTRKIIPLLSELFKAHSKKKQAIVILSDKEPKEVISRIEAAIYIPKNINIICRKGYGWQKKIPKLLDVEGASELIFLKPDIDDPQSPNRPQLLDKGEYINEEDCDTEVGKSMTAIINSKEFQKTGGNIIAEFSSNQKEELYKLYNIEKINSVIKKTNKDYYPLTIESEDIRARVISQAVNTPDIVEIYDELFSFEGSEIYFINISDQNDDILTKINKFNNKNIYELNLLFDHIICIGHYCNNDKNFNDSGKISFEQKNLNIVINPTNRIDFKKIDGLIFIAKEKKEIFDEINILDIEKKIDIKEINPVFKLYNEELNIGIISNDDSMRSHKIITNIINNNFHKNIKTISHIVDPESQHSKYKFDEKEDGTELLKSFLDKETIDKIKQRGIKMDNQTLPFLFFEKPRYPFSDFSEFFNPFNCIISFFHDNVDSDDNINNVKDHKAINQFILFSNMDINNKSFNEKPRTYITEVGAFKTKDILERHKNEIYSPFYGTDIIDINSLTSKIICAGTIDKKNVKLISSFLGGEYKIKTYSLKNKELTTSFCELEKYFSGRKEILIGIINYDFKDVKNDFKSNTPMLRRKIKEILINPDQKKCMSLDKGDRVITIS